MKDMRQLAMLTDMELSNLQNVIEGIQFDHGHTLPEMLSNLHFHIVAEWDARETKAFLPDDDGN